MSERATSMFRWCEKHQGFHLSLLSCTTAHTFDIKHIVRVDGYTVNNNIPAAWYAAWDRERQRLLNDPD